MTRKQAFRKACKIVGSQNKMAKAIGVSRQAVYQWMENGVPLRRAPAVEKATGGQITRQMLRPDMWDE